MSELNTNDYIDALYGNNQKVILRIYQDIFPKVNYFVLQNKGTQEDAEEVFQKALYQLTARVKVRKFEIKSSFEAYLFTACKNLWRRELNNRKKEVRNDKVIELVGEEQDHSRAIMEQERWELFEEKITELSDTCKKLLKAYFKNIYF